MVRRGFTLIELLVAMAVIAILASLILAGVNGARRAALKAKTESILAGVRAALGVTMAEHGGSLAPVEHPMAGSAEPRAGFVRAAGGAPLQPTGEALVVGDESWIALSERGRVLRADDRYRGGDAAGDCELPLLYGMPRGRIGVLGASTGAVTHLRRLPKPGSGYDDPLAKGTLASPYDNSRYPDAMFLVQPALPAGQTLEEATAQAVDYAVAQNRTELLQLGAIRVADEKLPLIKGDRLRAAPGPESPHWRPGDVRDGAVWKAYRLRGAAIYDAWGREILFSLGRNDAVRLESAGPDGVFRWSPGLDGVYQTAAEAEEPAGDDRDGQRDNVGAATRE